MDRRPLKLLQLLTLCFPTCLAIARSIAIRRAADLFLISLTIRKVENVRLTYRRNALARRQRRGRRILARGVSGDYYRLT